MIKIDAGSFIPIYEQVKQQVRRRIATGEWRSHDLIPSIRDLSARLLINPNTVARAYRELEMEGLITKRKGMGCYVSGNSSELLNREQGRMVEEKFRSCIDEAKHLGLAPEEIKMEFDRIFSAWIKAGQKGDR